MTVLEKVKAGKDKQGKTECSFIRIINIPAIDCQGVFLFGKLFPGFSWHINCSP